MVTRDGYLIDTVENILANKLTAIIGRDNPKDIFDLLLIHSHYTVSWPDILDAARVAANYRLHPAAQDSSDALRPPRLLRSI